MGKSINYFIDHYNELKDNYGVLRFHKIDCKTKLHFVINSADRMGTICSHWGYGAYNEDGTVDNKGKFPLDDYCKELNLDMDAPIYELYELNPNLRYR